MTVAVASPSTCTDKAGNEAPLILIGGASASPWMVAGAVSSSREEGPVPLLTATYKSLPHAPGSWFPRKPVVRLSVPLLLASERDIEAPTAPVAESVATTRLI